MLILILITLHSLRPFTLYILFFSDLQFSATWCGVKKHQENVSVFRWFFGFCDIFSFKLVLKRSKKGEKSHKNVIKIQKCEYFSLFNTLVISQNKNNSKKREKSLKKCWRERKSVYLCTRKTTGTRGWKGERLSSAVLWENDPSKVWKVSVKKPYQFWKINPSQDRKH